MKGQDPESRPRRGSHLCLGAEWLALAEVRLRGYLGVSNYTSLTRGETWLTFAVTSQSPLLIVSVGQESASPIDGPQESPNPVEIDQICHSLFLGSSHEKIVQPDHQ